MRFKNILQRLPSNEVRPSADFRGYDTFLLLRDLLIHALSEKNSGSWLHEERYAEIDSYNTISSASTAELSLGDLPFLRIT